MNLLILGGFLGSGKTSVLLKLAKAITEKDKSSNRKESRRHESLDTGVEAEWVRDKAPSPDDIVADDDAKERILRKAAKILTAKQLDAFQKICIERMTEKEYAKRVGISQPVTHRRVVAAKNKMGRRGLYKAFD